MTWPFGDTMMHVDCGRDLQTRKSTIGYVFLINNRVVSLSSCKQATFVLSTIETKYMAYHKHLKKLFGFITFLVNWFSNKRKTFIFSDNQGCLSFIKNLIHHSRSKHIYIQHHYVREMVYARTIKFEYVPIVKMVANMLTKVVLTKNHTLMYGNVRTTTI
jgi:hypothetical protein